MENEWVAEKTDSEEYGHPWVVHRDESVQDHVIVVQLADWLDEESARTLAQRMNG